MNSELYLEVRDSAPLFTKESVTREIYNHDGFFSKNNAWQYSCYNYKDHIHMSGYIQRDSKNEYSEAIYYIGDEVYDKLFHFYWTDTPDSSLRRLLGSSWVVPYYKGFISHKVPHASVKEFFSVQICFEQDYSTIRRILDVISQREGEYTEYIREKERTSKVYTFEHEIEKKLFSLSSIPRCFVKNDGKIAIRPINGNNLLKLYVVPSSSVPEVAFCAIVSDAGQSQHRKRIYFNVGPQVTQAFTAIQELQSKFPYEELDDLFIKHHMYHLSDLCFTDPIAPIPLYCNKEGFYWVDTYGDEIPSIRDEGQKLYNAINQLKEFSPDILIPLAKKYTDYSSILLEKAFYTTLRVGLKLIFLS